MFSNSIAFDRVESHSTNYQFPTFLLARFPKNFFPKNCQSSYLVLTFTCLNSKFSKILHITNMITFKKMKGTWVMISRIWFSHCWEKAATKSGILMTTFPQNFEAIFPQFFHYRISPYFCKFKGLRKRPRRLFW